MLASGHESEQSVLTASVLDAGREAAMTERPADPAIGRRTLLRGGAIAGLAGVPLLTTGTTPAHAVTVDARLAALWQANQSRVGQPISAPVPVSGGICQEFQAGTMFHHPSAGASIIRGKIRHTYFLGGGPSVMGFPVGVEETSRDYASCFRQGTWLAGVTGWVWWSTAHGGLAVPAARTVRLPGALNFRDAAGEGAGLAAGDGRMRRGLLYRSPRTGSLPPLSRFVLQTLGITQVVSLGSTDASIPGIRVVRAPVVNSSGESDEAKLQMYRNYITQAGNRASIGKAVRLIAASDAPVLVHCAAGKDRTGLTIALIHLTLGVSRADAYTEYLRSNEYTGRPAAVKALWLEAGLDEISRRYGSVRSFLTAGCGVSSAELTALRARLLA